MTADEGAHGTWGEGIPEPDWHLYTPAELAEFWGERVPEDETVTADRARELWAAERGRKVARLEEIKAALLAERQHRLDAGLVRMGRAEADLAAELAQQAAADGMTVTDPVLAEEIRESAWEYERVEGELPDWYHPGPNEAQVEAEEVRSGAASWAAPPTPEARDAPGAAPGNEPGGAAVMTPNDNLRVHQLAAMATSEIEAVAQMNLPLRKTPSGVTVWAVPGRDPGQQSGLQHLTWNGPGDAIHRHTRGIAQDGIEYPGRDIRTVSGPCQNDAEAQQAVDTYLASLEQERTAAADGRTLARTGLPAPVPLRSPARVTGAPPPAQDSPRGTAPWLDEILQDAGHISAATAERIRDAIESDYLESRYIGQGEAWDQWAARQAAQSELAAIAMKSDPVVSEASQAYWEALQHAISLDEAAGRAGGDLDISTPEGLAAEEASRRYAEVSRAAFERHLAQVKQAWRDADAGFLSSHRADLEASLPEAFRDAYASLGTDTVGTVTGQSQASAVGPDGGIRAYPPAAPAVPRERAVTGDQAVSHEVLAAGALAVALSAGDLRSVIAQAGPADPRIGQCLPLIAQTALSLADCVEMIEQADPGAVRRTTAAFELHHAVTAIAKATAQPPEKDSRPITGRAAWLRARLRRPPGAEPQPDAGPLPAEARFTADRAARLAHTLLPGYLAGAARAGLDTPELSPAVILPLLADTAFSLGWCANSATVAAGLARAPFEATWQIETAARSLWTASSHLRGARAQPGGPVTPGSVAARSARDESPVPGLTAGPAFTGPVGGRRPAVHVGRPAGTTSSPAAKPNSRGLQ
jgi:hypothetical protein